MEETPFHFFKVIQPSTLQDKKLGIPNKFVKKFGNDLSTFATLTVPNGRVWKVGLMKDGRKCWFHDGWHDFVEYHSISAGHFLLFKYGKHSNFHVIIFDMSACEIQYPHYPVGLENDNSVEIIGSLAPKPPAVDSALEINSCRKKSTASLESQKLKHDHETRSKSLKMEEVVELNESDTTEHELLAILEEMGIFITMNFRKIAAKEKERAIAAAKLFKPENPSFMVIMQPRNKKSLYVPFQFAKEYLINRDAKLIMLLDRDGREWSVKFHRNRPHGSAGDITQGWDAFAKDHNLKNGDICIFELIRKKKIVLKVSIFHSI